MQSDYTDSLHRWFTGLGFADYGATVAVDFTQVIVVLTIAFIANWIAMLDDIRDSIRELQYYREHFIRTKKP